MTNIPKAVDFKNAIEQFLSKNDISHLELAKRLNIKPSHLSCLKNGSGNHVSAQVKRRVWNTIRPNIWKIVNTINFEVIQKYCEDTRRNCMLNGLVGEPGLGKTIALSSYSKYKKNVFMVRFDITMTPRDLFIAILEAMQVFYSGSINNCIKRIADELLNYESPLIIIDESDKMPVKLFNYIHVLRNSTCDTTGILLSGVNSMVKRIHTASSRDVQGLREFSSRVMHWEYLTMPLKSEILEICEVNCIYDQGLIKELCKCINYREIYNKVMVNKIGDEDNDFSL